MENWITAVLKILIGLVVLVGGGELLVRGASRLAAAWKVSPLVIGLTVVAFGTSAPELAVSVQAAWAGSGDLALGNVVGSNIFNVLFILGVSALIAPLTVSSRLVRLDVPLMIIVSLLVLGVGLDGRINRLEGLALVLGICAYTWWCIRQSRKENAAINAEFAQEWPQGKLRFRSVTLDLLLIIGSLGMLGLGSRLLVEGSAWIAENLGVGERVIGLTIVAAGTSLPEVVTSIVAALRGERDIAVGNVVGSNIFNILCVLGLSSAIVGVNISPSVLWFDIPVMIAVAIACLPIFFTGHLIARWEGGLFIFYYLAYTSYLVLRVSGNQLAHPLRDVMLLFVMPLTVLTLAISVWRSWKQRHTVTGHAGENEAPR